VGRERHVRELRLIIEALLAGRGNLLLLAGEAGVGKTRLAEEALDLAQHACIATRWATCFSGGGSPPLAPWRGLLGLGEREAAPIPPDADTQASRFRLFDQTWQVARDALGPAPMIVVLDDFHWADPLSAGFLAFVAPRLHLAPLALLVTYRDDAPGAMDAVVSDLVRYGRQLLVPPLDLGEFREFTAQVAITGLSEQRLRQLHVRTGGNALFARELIRLLEAGGDAALVRQPPLPLGVRDVLLERVARLSGLARMVLAAGSIIGTEFRLDLLGHVVALRSPELLEALDEATRARVVNPAGVGRWRFTHPLMREAIYEGMSLARRVRLHQEVAMALEQLAEAGSAVAVSELASHLVHAAAAGDAARAVAACDRAGQEAMTAVAYEDAARWFEAALGALDLCPADDTLRADLLLALGDALVATGNVPDGRRAHADAARLARSLGSAERLGHAALGVGSGLGGFEIPLFDREQIDLLEEALTALPQPSGMRARLLARLSVALSLAAPSERRQRLAEEAASVARAVGDTSALGYALAALCDVLAAPTHSARRRAAADEIVALARPLSDARLELLGQRLRFVANLEVGDVAAADADIQAFAAIAERIHQPVYSWYVPLWRGMRAAMEGRFDDAFGWRGAAASLGAAANSENAAMLTESLRTLELLERGEADEALAFFRSALERWPDYTVMTRPPLAYAEATAGNRIAARAILDQVDVDDYEPGSLGAEWLPALVMLADATWLVGGHHLARRLYDALAPFRTRHAVDGIGDYDLGSVERPLGLLATLLHLDEAACHFEAALAEHRRIGAALLVARMLRDAGDATGDARLLTQAREHYARLGVPGRVGEVEGLLARRFPVAVDGASFRRNGGTWTVTYGGMTLHLRHTKGMTDIAALLAREGQEIHVLDLFAVGAPRNSATTGPLIDDMARSEYKQRLADLEEEIDDADRLSDDARFARLHAERDALVARLAAAYGLGGRPRTTGDPAERARSAVTQRVRDAIARLGHDHPELGVHLAHSVKTGTFCSYVPECLVGWDVDLTP